MDYTCNTCALCHRWSDGNGYPRSSSTDSRDKRNYAHDVKTPQQDYRYSKYVQVRRWSHVNASPCSSSNDPQDRRHVGWVSVQYATHAPARHPDYTRNTGLLQGRLWHVRLFPHSSSNYGRDRPRDRGLAGVRDTYVTRVGSNRSWSRYTVNLWNNSLAWNDPHSQPLNAHRDGSWVGFASGHWGDFHYPNRCRSYRGFRCYFRCRCCWICFYVLNAPAPPQDYTRNTNAPQDTLWRVRRSPRSSSKRRQDTPQAVAFAWGIHVYGADIYSIHSHSCNDRPHDCNTHKWSPSSGSHDALSDVHTDASRRAQGRCARHVGTDRNSCRYTDPPDCWSPNTRLVRYGRRAA